MNKPREPATKTAPAVTDAGREFETVLCEKCGNDTFYIGIFAGKTPDQAEIRYQCVKCYPTTELTVH